MKWPICLLLFCSCGSPDKDDSQPPTNTSKEPTNSTTSEVPKAISDVLDESKFTFLKKPGLADNTNNAEYCFVWEFLYQDGDLERVEFELITPVETIACDSYCYSCSRILGDYSLSATDKRTGRKYKLSTVKKVDTQDIATPKPTATPIICGPQPPQQPPPTATPTNTPAPSPTATTTPTPVPTPTPIPTMTVVHTYYEGSYYHANPSCGLDGFMEPLNYRQTKTKTTVVFITQVYTECTLVRNGYAFSCDHRVENRNCTDNVLTMSGCRLTGYVCSVPSI